MGFEGPLPSISENNQEQETFATLNYLNEHREKILGDFEGNERHGDIEVLVGNLNELNDEIESLGEARRRIVRDKLIGKITPVIIAVTGLVGGFAVGELGSVLNVLGSTLIVLGMGGGALYGMLEAAKSKESSEDITEYKNREEYYGKKRDSALFELQRFIDESRAAVTQSLVSGGATWDEPRIGADGKEYQGLTVTENQIEQARRDAAQDGVQINRE